MTEQQKVKVFQCLLDKFETKEVRLYCEDMIMQIPDYIFTMPSSTTGKWHNATQCQPHGQIYHIIMFGTIMNHLLNLKNNKKRFDTPEIRDSLRCVAIYHDAFKLGDGSTQYTLHQHPLLAGTWVREAKTNHDIDNDLKEAIACMCERHSGEFTTSKNNSLVLPEPETMAEFFIHECDILSSRADIDMQPPEYLKEIFGENIPTTLDVNTPMIFGKYKGMPISTIYKKHKDYIQWLKTNTAMREPLRSIIRQLENEDKDFDL